jgi:hypothetical protein
VHRRLTALVVVLALAGLVSACGATGDTAASSPTTTPKPEYKVTVAGDSISVGLGASLRKFVGPDVVVKVIGEEGTGLARPPMFDWPARLQQLAREFPPTVLVFSVSSNDAQDLVDGQGRVVAPSSTTAAWDAEYSKRLAASFDAFQGTSTRILWVGHVRTADDRIGLVNRRIQKLAAAVAASRPWVTVTDLGVLLGSGEGRATRCLSPDGLHLTVPCLDEAAKALQAALPPPPPA